MQYINLGYFKLEKYAHCGRGKGLNQIPIIPNTSLITKGHSGGSMWQNKYH